MAEELKPLLTAETKTKVSSTLDKSVGKKYLTDGSPETCWASQQGTPQHIQITFKDPVVPKRLSITFQGGFVGTRCALEVRSGDSVEWRTWTRVYPEDVNRAQSFDLPDDMVQDSINSLRLVFEESSDFFGRITVYDLQLFGKIL
ncbi:galactose-binding domain-like protein [Abortiporus biennis]|nr:galactose-binding domain-like protein [Abortiporus biennis]